MRCARLRNILVVWADCIAAELGASKIQLQYSFRRIHLLVGVSPLEAFLRCYKEIVDELSTLVVQSSGPNKEACSRHDYRLRHADLQPRSLQELWCKAQPRA